MIKVTSMVLAASLLLGGLALSAPAAEERGGVVGFFVGCCLGLRTGADWNDGKALHWRDWGRLIPYFNIYVGIIDGIDTSKGTTNADLQRRFGSTYY